jgi:hypothetical protein
MKIRLVGHEGQHIFPFGNSGPWVAFRESFINAGHQFVEEDFGTQIDVLIANRHSEEAMNEALISGVPINRRILIIWEPKVVDQSSYKKSVLRQYGEIFAGSYLWAEELKVNYFFWPQNYSQVSNYLVEARKPKIILMQANKFSARNGELYSLRRKVINELVDSGLPFDLWGPDWNKGILFDLRKWFASFSRMKFQNLSRNSLWSIGKKYNTYKGTAIDKFSKLQEYKVSIVIENSADYVSEKLFDSVFSGCLVVYVGAPLSYFKIDSRKIIQTPPEVDQITREIKKLLLLSASEAEKIVGNQIKELMRVKQSWENNSVLENLAKTICKHLEEDFSK